MTRSALAKKEGTTDSAELWRMLITMLELESVELFGAVY